jgi:hypothetical protein
VRRAADAIGHGLPVAVHSEQGAVSQVPGLLCRRKTHSLVFEGVLRRDDSLLLLLFRTQVFCREKGKYKIKLLYKSWFHIACNVRCSVLPLVPFFQRTVWTVCSTATSCIACVGCCVRDQAILRSSRVWPNSKSTSSAGGLKRVR